LFLLLCPNVRRQDATKIQMNPIFPLYSDIVFSFQFVFHRGANLDWITQEKLRQRVRNGVPGSLQTSSNLHLLLIPLYLLLVSAYPVVCGLHLNHSRTGHGSRATDLVRSCHFSDPTCIREASEQTTKHIADGCPLTRFPGGPWALRLADDEAGHTLEEEAPACR